MRFHPKFYSHLKSKAVRTALLKITKIVIFHCEVCVDDTKVQWNAWDASWFDKFNDMLQEALTVIFNNSE